MPNRRPGRERRNFRSRVRASRNRERRRLRRRRRRSRAVPCRSHARYRLSLTRAHMRSAPIPLEWSSLGTPVESLCRYTGGSADTLCTRVCACTHTFAPSIVRWEWSAVARQCRSRGRGVFPSIRNIRRYRRLQPRTVSRADRHGERYCNYTPTRGGRLAALSPSTTVEPSARRSGPIHREIA
jgi:hypothetical protein